MLKAKNQGVVNVRVDKVFGYLADLERRLEDHHKDLSVNVQKTSEGPLGVGSTFRMVSSEREAWKRGEWKYGRERVEVREFVPNQRLVYEVFPERPGLFDMARRVSIEVDPVADGARITVSRELLLLLPLGLLYLPFLVLIAALSWPLRRWATSRAWHRLEERLKAEQ